MTRVLVLRAGDDVAVALEALAAGDVVEADGRSVEVTGQVPAGHKVALVQRRVGDPVRKYSQVIGVATADIAAGEHVHTHNLAFVPVARGDVDRVAREERAGVSRSRADVSRSGNPDRLPRTFLGYRRPDGRAATRNYIGIVTSVNCAASVAQMVERHFTGRLDDHPNVDGVVALTHDSGCGLVAGSDGARLFERTLVGTATHPNFAALVVVGLGCEMLLAGELFAQLSSTASQVLVIQDEGGVSATVAAAVAEVERLLPEVGAVEREPIGVDELVLSVKCGGSDGYSGITANPALGHTADLLVGMGGRVVIGETPEVYGAEHLLTERAVSSEVADKLDERIAWWRDYTAVHGGSLDNNPSPGNKDGGITTIVEKSLGAVAKAGSSPLADVVGYAEPIVADGLTFMDTPGYDPVSVTGMIAGGANVVVFTTGRGSMFGSRPAPCIKVATNSAMYARLAGDMDFDAGVVLDGVSIEQVGEQLFREVVEVASGRATASERLGIGADEFIPWHLGAVV
ncbi:UxaA family hydrolase [Aestuariimicrobium ganziense]|uniref:UxaA family hydrolase n=1 Tax=Aestuariimicrobium ganziense TaxID=2773677 RepID=UPI0019410A88|nr:altronate dehydratase family protein [Aestuariimicrobium ganziense]